MLSFSRRLVVKRFCNEVVYLCYNYVYICHLCTTGLQRVVPIEMRGHLLWQKTDEIYINVSVRQNLGAVLCGDNEGSIWIYDLDPYLDDLHSSSRKRFHVKPIKV